VTYLGRVIFNLKQTVGTIIRSILLLDEASNVMLAEDGTTILEDE
jgi:hypothetical protein